MNSGLTQRQQILYNEAQYLFDEIRSKPWLAEGMREHGYDAAAWGHGKSLASAAFNLARVRAAAGADQLAATDAFNELFDDSWPYFQLLMQTCATLCRGKTGWLGLLGLHEARLNGNSASQISKPQKNDAYPGTLLWLGSFYEVAKTHPDIAALLAENNFPPQRVANDAVRVVALNEANRRQNEAIAAKVQAVKDRDAAFRQLKVWLRRAQRQADVVKKKQVRNQPAPLTTRL
jgi:hypothetical protein